MELSTDCLTKQYDKKIVVDRISMTLNKGVYGLLGANGAGKTTLIRMMCGILKPTSGEVTFNGVDVTHEDYRDALGYMPQFFGYYPEFNAMEFLCYMGCLKGLTKKRARERSKELLELVSLTDVAGSKIKTFSGGMKQRLGIAQALLNNPKILILDEPTAGLDPKERVRFRSLISQLGEDKIVLLSTHIVSDIESIAANILIMKGGRLLHKGTLEEITALIEGKVFECNLDRTAAEALISKYPVINLRYQQDRTLLRLVCEEKPCVGAVNAAATLEDVYLYYFSEVNPNAKLF